MVRSHGDKLAWCAKEMIFGLTILQASRLETVNSNQRHAFGSTAATLHLRP